MTTTEPATAPTAPAELATTSAAKRLLAKPGVTLTDVLTAIAGATVAKAPETTVAKAAAKDVTPKPVALPQELIDSIASFTEQAKAVREDLPQKRTKLTIKQKLALGKLYRSARKIHVDTKKLIDDTIRVAFFNHFDVLAEAAEGFDPETAVKDKNGFYVVAGEETIPDVGTVKREVKAGTPSVDLAVIAKAIAEGRLPATATNGITRATRVFDDEKAVRWFAKNPQYAGVLAEATKVSGASGSLQLR